MRHQLNLTQRKAINRLGDWVLTHHITLEYLSIKYDTDDILGVLSNVNRDLHYNDNIGNWLNALRKKYINSKINNL